MNHAFCTLFDSRYSSQGIAMLKSLDEYMPGSQKFVLALDDCVADLLKKTFGSTVRVITLRDFESPELLKVKPTRSKGEYCWTMTPLLPKYILENYGDVDSITYVDADLFFLSNPQRMLDELESTNKFVLITEHGYDPQYDQTELSGRFCVQFVTFKRHPEALKVLHWWSEKCLEWCFNRHEDGKFGDQKYLDVWPDLFSSSVHIYSKPFETLAPWNIEYWLKLKPDLDPVFYHFHGLSVFKDKIRLFENYKISSPRSLQIYKKYADIIIALYHQNHEFVKAIHPSFNSTLPSNPLKYARFLIKNLILRMTNRYALIQIWGTKNEK